MLKCLVSNIPSRRMSHTYGPKLTQSSFTMVENPCCGTLVGDRHLIRNVIVIEVGTFSGEYNGVVVRLLIADAFERNHGHCLDSLMLQLTSRFS